MTMQLDVSQGVAVFTDGSAYHKDRSGGWAYLALDAFGTVTEASGSRQGVTNNQMELFAPTMALLDVYGEYGECAVLVYSDSQYVVLGATDTTRARKKNKEWWTSLDMAMELHSEVLFVHVKGHADNEFNNRADVLAGKARKEGKVE